LSSTGSHPPTRDLIYDVGQVEQLCVLLFDAHYSGEVERQRPFLIADKGDHWQVDGSWNRDKRFEMSGPVFMSIQKSDARVTDFGMWGVIHPDPATMRRIEEEERRRKTLGISYGALPHQPGRILDFINLMSGGLINSAELAERIGEMLLSSHFGSEEIAGQLPLLAADRGDSWDIEGGPAPKREAGGRFCMRIRKHDGQVTEFGLSKASLRST
jgi:hypothetical protein